MTGSKLPEITDAELQILMHALGIKGSQSEPSRRNHFVTDPASEDGSVCEALVAKGVMTRVGSSEITGGDTLYAVRPDLRIHVKDLAADRFPEPKTSAAKERYLEWLDVGDVSGMKFGDWLKKGMYKKSQTPGM